MLSCYLHHAIINDICPYMSWDTLFYHNCPDDIWASYCQRLGFQKNNKWKCWKDQFFHDIFSKYPSYNYPGCQFLCNIFGNLHYETELESIPLHLWTNKKFIIFCLRHIGLFVLDYVPQTTLNKYFPALMSIKIQTTKYFLPTKQSLIEYLKINPYILCYADEIYRRDLDIIIDVCSNPNWILGFTVYSPDMTSRLYDIFKPLCQKGKFDVLNYILRNNYKVLCEYSNHQYPIYRDEMDDEYNYEPVWDDYYFDEDPNYEDFTDPDDMWAATYENHIQTEIQSPKIEKGVRPSEIEQSNEIEENIPDDIHTFDEDDYMHDLILEAIVSDVYKNLLRYPYNTIFFRVFC